MTNERLVVRIKAGSDVSANMARLWQQNQGLIGQMAGRYEGIAEEEDLKQEAYFGLCEAVKRYDPAVGVKFNTYARYWIRRQMIRYIQNSGLVRIPIQEGASVKKYNDLRSRVLAETGHEPTDQEISRHLKLSLYQVREVKKASRMEQIGSLDAYIQGKGESTVRDMLPGSGDVENCVLDKVEAEQLKAVLWPMVGVLPGKEPEVLRSRFQEGLTLQAIGEQYGTTPERIRQIEKEAYRELRKSKRRRQLLPFWEEYISVQAFRGNGVGEFRRTWTSSTERAALLLMEKKKA